MAYSEALEETIFLCEDEATKAALVEAGADAWSIYTKSELPVLVAHNRVKPFLPDELFKLRASKQTFHGRIAPGLTHSAPCRPPHDDSLAI
jgi:hypothetical protein